jgi:hypothetical protein
MPIRRPDSKAGRRDPFTKRRTSSVRYRANGGLICWRDRMNALVGSGHRDCVAAHI